MPVLPPPSLKAPSVERKISRARWTLAWEAVWPRAIPVLGFVALFFTAAHLNLFAGLPPWPHVGLLAALVLALAGVSWWSFRGFAWPDANTAERRLERDGGVTHRPLMAVDDTLALGSGDSLSAALFEAHRRREAARLAALKVNAPSPGMTARDPSAWRFVPLFLLVAAVGVAGGWSWDRVETAVTPAFPPPPPVTVDLWLAPPAYTRRPPI
jgi:hypothetical protein